jgi:choline kinase
MDALILSSGRGSPTCLVEVGGRPLLSHQFAAAKAAGALRVTIVTGRAPDRLRAAFGDRVEIVRNARHAETSSLYSFWLARHRVRGDVLVLDGDLLFPHQVLLGLLHRGSALAFDSRSVECGEHLKVSVRDGRLLELGEDLTAVEAGGANLGLLHLTEDVARSTFDAAGRLLERGHDRDRLGSALNVVARRHPIACVDVAGLPWVGINDPRGLVQARAQVWPAIAKLRSGSAALRARLHQTDRLLDSTLDRGGSSVGAGSRRAAGRTLRADGVMQEQAPVYVTL